MQQQLRHPGEYYALIVLSTIGAIYMAAARELLTAYISLELLSFSLYVLVSFANDDRRSNEGGMKYMLLGRVRVGAAALRHEPDLRHGRHRPSTTTSRRRSRTGRTASTLGLLVGLVLLLAGLGLQGGGRAVPHVDAGRLRGRAAADHELPLGRRRRRPGSRCCCGCSRAPSCRSSTTGSG